MKPVKPPADLVVTDDGPMRSGGGKSRRVLLCHCASRHLRHVSAFAWYLGCVVVVVGVRVRNGLHAA